MKQRHIWHMAIPHDACGAYERFFNLEVWDIYQCYKTEEKYLGRKMSRHMKN